MTEPEVAQAMGVATGTVAATLSKARAALARDLEPPPRGAVVGVDAPTEPRRPSDG